MVKGYQRKWSLQNYIIWLSVKMELILILFNGLYVVCQMEQDSVKRKIN